MKSIWLLGLLFFGCTRKYADYDVINKLKFRDNPQERPVAPVMQISHKDDVEECFNQWLFFSNAETEKNRYLPALVQVLCPGSEWLVDTRITQQWWTTIIFTRACVNVEAHCPVKKPKEMK
ncbi:MAG: hypothetical protein K2P81_17110 [Bacteriovoracaceae bacterium]|nr:hypothetical protein [Bacteriovoracaceae bacterium]